MKKTLVTGIAALTLVGTAGAAGLATAPAHATPSAAVIATSAPSMAEKQAMKQAILAALETSPVDEEIEEVEEAGTAEEAEVEEPGTGSAGSSSGSAGSSSGSSSGSADLEPIIDDFLENFDWAVVTVPLISIFLQAQGLPAVVATPLAQLIWSVIEAISPARAA
ncbi:hypothetical protein GIY30_01895 [Gordonia sp. HNM0687]|uniref:Uncharacterized protein n=1 Tax=Gordonia mangrovi TaxID=2665643 RepID=A0A6L7GKQ2_9ACTN|nr:hypothetical protein [Gordonia mangrovi]MXP20122.1 hypothetical protein [Gordonia mangrovi]UVF79268.1 hypothetical protein NWF22_05350 [Gordonia mangrovi]